jgi:hypothetical protein
MWKLQPVALINSCHWPFTDSDDLAVKFHQKLFRSNLLLLQRMLTSILPRVVTTTSAKFSCPRIIFTDAGLKKLNELEEK